jgi:hypothetical protein
VNSSLKKRRKKTQRSQPSVTNKYRTHWSILALIPPHCLGRSESKGRNKYFLKIEVRELT